MAAAVKGRGGATGAKILGVTVLTSLSEDDLKDLRLRPRRRRPLVERRIRQAIDAGIDGVVASPPRSGPSPGASAVRISWW